MARSDVTPVNEAPRIEARTCAAGHRRLLIEADRQLEDRPLPARQRKQDLQFAGGEALPLE
jgi:hypothetical protein